MDLNKEFLQGINDAFSSDKEQVRTKAHAQLLKLATDDPNLVLSLSVGAFSNAALPPGMRALIGTFFAQLLLPRQQEVRASIWPALLPASKQLVKDACLKQLIDDNPAVMRAAASLVAAVFALDCISDNAWEELLPVLTDNVENSEVKIQKAAVLSLGNICDVLNKHHITELKEHRVDSLLSGICKGLNRYNELTETAVQALDDSLQFLRQKIDNEQISDFIMELLVKILREAQHARSGVEAERKLLYCLGKIAKMLFERLGKYYQILFEEVLGSYKRGDAGVFVACNSFFTEMVVLEERYQTNFMKDAWKPVMEWCIKRLSDITDIAEEDEAAGNSTLLSVLDTMTAVNRVYFEFTAEPVKGFITVYIEKESDDSRVVALAAFESMLEMPRSEGLVAFVGSGFYGVLNFLQNGSPLIRKHASRFLLKLIRHLPEIFFNDANFHRGTKILLGLMESVDGSDLSVALQCNVGVMLSELTQSTKTVAGAAALLRSLSDKLFDAICALSLSSESLPVIDGYFSVVFDFLQRVVDPKYLGDYLLSFDRFLKSLRGRAHKHQLSLYEFIFINMTVIVTTIKKSNVKFFAHSPQSPAEFLRELYRTIAEVFAALNAVVSEGLLLMATVLSADMDWARAALPEFVRVYLSPALQDYQQNDLFKGAVDSVSVCCKTFEGELEPFVAEIYPYFLSLLANDLVLKELKVTIFFALADFVLHCPTVSRSFLPKILELAELALQAVLHFQSSELEEQLDYAEAFKETLIDFYLCLIHGIYLRSEDCDVPIEQSMRRVSDFMRLTSADKLNPTISYQSNCLGLLADFYGKKKMPQMVDLDLIGALGASLQKHTNYGDVGGTLEYARKYFSSI